MFNELAKEIHEGNAARGFWEGERKLTEVVMLTVCELSEAIEADRSGNRMSHERYANYLNNPTPDNFKRYIKDTVQDEIADAMIRLLDFSHKFGYNLDEGIEYSKSKFEGVYFDSNDLFVNNAALISIFINKIFTIDISKGFFYAEENGNSESKVCDLIVMLIKLTEAYNIDLDFHIKHKLLYNASRPYKHGKGY